MDPLDRIRADLAGARVRRLVDRAVARGWLDAAKAGPLRDAPSPEEALVVRGGLRPSQVEELAREIDGPAAPGPAASRYELGEKIGEGAVSLVYRAVDRELGRTVAVKVLRDGVVTDDRARERFHREARSLARMDHPHVVKVHDAGWDGTRPYLVMELAEAGSLGRALRESAPGDRRVLEWIEQAARGVAHAHARGVVHRDLKPENLLVGSNGAAKVADFGLAHFLEAATALTRTGTVLGTPIYMAPEQVHGSEVTARTDVYALGVILYEAIAGRPPFTGDTVVSLYPQILHREPAPPRAWNPGVPPAVEAVALKAMEKDPALRYPTAEAFADDLKRFLDGVPVEARPVSALRRLWRRAIRDARALGVAALVGAVLAVLAAGLIRNRLRLQDSLARAAEDEAAGRVRSARERYLAALALDPSARQAREGADRTGEALTRAERLLEEARTRLDRANAAGYDARLPVETYSGAASDALRLAREAVAAAPDLAMARLRLGEAEELRGAYEAAAAAYQDALERDPKLGPAWHRLGRVRLWRAYLDSLNMWSVPDPADTRRAEDRVRSSIEALERARAEGSGADGEVRREIAEAMLDYLKGAPDGVRRRCAEAIARHAGREGVEELHWLLGLVEPKRSDGKVHFDRALALRPRFPLALYARAWATGDREDFSAAIACAPEFAEPYIFRGSSYLQEPGKTALAAADFDWLVNQGVHLAPAYNGRARARLIQGDAEAAIADATRAIEIRPKGYHLPWQIRAEARLALGRFAEAAEDAAAARDRAGDAEGRRKAEAVLQTARAGLEKR